MKGKLVIIGANEFQRPLIQKAVDMGYETHVFAWKEGAVGARYAHKFYDISIVEKDEILKKCRQIQPDGVVTIGSDLANITVQYLADQLGLPGNSAACILKSTNKYEMRKAFQKAGLPVPGFWETATGEEIPDDLWPLIVKPTDRSGSRAITRVASREELADAVKRAAKQSFEHKAIVEGYLEGAEYSVESVSFQGRHICLAVTKKFTTGAPDYIEKGHMQPADLEEETVLEIKKVVMKALDALEIENGASHAEIRLDRQGRIHIIEIGSRMGGDCIGSHLVPLSTGQDYVKMVIQTALGQEPQWVENPVRKYAGIRFLFCQEDFEKMEYIRRKYPQAVTEVQIDALPGSRMITDSGSRLGYYMIQADSKEEFTQIYYARPFQGELEILKTPVYPLSLELNDNSFYIKREDFQPLSFGGNKVRFARGFLEDLQKKHCDSMIIYGNYNSNLCRILSAVCRRYHMPCAMIYNVDDVKEEKGKINQVMIETMGVRPYPCHKGPDIAKAVEQAMDDLYERGFRPYYIYGDSRGKGNETVPMEAYVQAYKEIREYERKHKITFDYIFLASSTNATQSGLIAGTVLEHTEKDTRIVGISVSRNQERGMEVIRENLREYMGKVESQADDPCIIFTDAYLEGGYGVRSEKIRKVIKRVYETEGLYLDETYTGKAWYGMEEYIREHQIKGKNILFLHTGGAPLFFQEAEELLGEKNE